MLAIKYLNISFSTLLIPLIFIGFFVYGVHSSLAYEVVEHSPGQPYEALMIEPVSTIERWYLGTLSEFPQMLTLNLKSESSIALSLRVPSTVDLKVMRPNLLLVRDVEPGVIEEVIKMEFDETQWQKDRDPRSGLAFYTPDPLLLDLPAGEYRIEISSANNQGKYMLVTGNDAGKQSYGASMSTIVALYDFYEVSRVFMIRSPFIYFPLGIVLLLGLAGLTWRYRDRLLTT